MHKGKDTPNPKRRHKQPMVFTKDNCKPFRANKGGRPKKPKPPPMVSEMLANITRVLEAEIKRIQTRQVDKPEASLQLGDVRFMNETAKTLIALSKEQRALREESLDDIADGKMSLDDAIDDIIRERKISRSKHSRKEKPSTQDTLDPNDLPDTD